MSGWWDVYYGQGKNKPSGMAVQADNAASARKVVQAVIGASYPGYSIVKVTGPYPTQDAAVKALGNAPGAPVPKTPGINVPNPAAAAADVGKFLGDLGQRNLWLRVAKIVVGLALIITGVIQLTHAQNLAAKAVKGAVLA